MTVYFIHAPEVGLLKIGYAERPIERLRKMQVDSPTRLVLLAIEDGDTAVEAARHDQFADLRERGEWFRYEGALVDHVDSLNPFERPRRKIEGPLAEIRERLGLSQAEMAEQLGINQSSVSRFERGTLPLDKRTLLAAQALLAMPA